MSDKKALSQQEVIDANIYVHSSIVSEYDNEPHFRPENKKKVTNRLVSLINDLPKNPEKRLLDFGCGTGFIIDLIKDRFHRIDGVDVTQAMLDCIDTTSGNIYLHNGPAEQTPFADSTFDMTTAYSFMDHLVDYKELLKEAFRVLKPGGLFYIDLNPNRKFWQSLQEIDATNTSTHKFITDEVYATIHNDERVSQQYNIDKEKLILAEPEKTKASGFDAEEVLDAARKIGFNEVKVNYHWYLAQAKVMHNQSFEDANVIDEHLQRLLPLTQHLYKYLEFVLVK